MTKITVRGKVVKHGNGTQYVTRLSVPKKFADDQDLQAGDEVLFRVLLIKKGVKNEKNI